VSNGRTYFFLDSLHDFDENKAFGLRLRLTYEGDQWSLAIGGYGYYGAISDYSKRVVLHLDENGSLDRSQKKPLQVKNDYLRKADEYSVAGDVLLQLFGVRLQSEVVYSYIDYKKTTPFRQEFAVMSGVPMTEELYYPTYYGWDCYVLLAWELPLSRWIAPVRISPYVMYEYSKDKDISPYSNFQLVSGGLNIKPSSYVTLKLEYLYGIPKSSIYNEPLKIVQAQMAVSF
jgi:hypothetical protein